MRYLLAILVLFATVSRGAEPGTYTPTIAAAAGFSTVAKPTPPPAPDPGNICPDCNGKGWNGDGTHRFKCEPCNGTGKRTMTATDNTAVEQPEAEVNLPAGERNPPAASMSEPKEAEEQEVPPPVVYNLPAVFTDYTTAALEATSSRELLVVLHPGYSLESQAKVHRNIAATRGTSRFVWLLIDADSTIKGQRAQDFFGASHPTSAIRHNPVTGTSKPVRSPKDLE